MSFLPGVGNLIARTLGLTLDEPASSTGRGNRQTTHESDGASSSGPSNVGPDVFQPSPKDVLVTKAMLISGLKLPYEIVLPILEFAEYWPHTSAVLDRSFIVGHNREDQFVMRSKPLGLIKKVHYDDHYYTFTPPQPLPHSEDGHDPLSQYQKWIGGPTDTLEYPCRKIVFTIHSRDQGWGGSVHDRGSYHGSWTWFEAGLERFDKNATHPKDTPEKDAASDEAPATEAGESSADRANEVLPEPYFPVYGMRAIYPTLEADRPAFHHDLFASPERTIQKNKVATRKPMTHRIVWSWKDDINPLTAEQLDGLGRGVATGNGDFVRNLKLGDVVTVWAKSRFAGWANHVERVNMDIYWAL